jgi:hypothetical protein
MGKPLVDGWAIDPDGGSAMVPEDVLVSAQRVLGGCLRGWGAVLDVASRAHGELTAGHPGPGLGRAHEPWRGQVRAPPHTLWPLWPALAEGSA